MREQIRTEVIQTVGLYAWEGKIMIKKGRRCPICNDNNKEILYTHKLFLPELLSFMPDTLDIVCCKACGMIYTSSDATQNTYDQYYDTLHAYSVDKNTHTDSEEDVYTLEHREHVFNIIKEYVNSEFNIIDVGTGTGGMLQTFQKHGFQHLLGIDIDDKSESMRKRGFEFLQGSVNNLSLMEFPRMSSACKDSLYILNGVLEHIFDVHTAMCSLAQTLQGEDIVFIMVPDADEYTTHFDRPFRYFGMEHINHFNSNTLRILFEKYGFEVINQGKFEYRLNDINSDPAIYLLAKKAEVEKDKTGRETVMSYIKKSRENEVDINRKIQELFDSQKEIIVWGVGSFFMTLCKTTKLLSCRLKFLADNNSSLQGTTLEGLVIKTPEEIRAYPECCICIVSAAYSENILEEIENMRLENTVIVI